MLELLLWLVLLLFGAGGSSSSSSSGTATATAPTAAKMHIVFTIDGRQVDARGSIRLRQGELLVFNRGIDAITVNRLECHADAHHIALTKRRWRVPDLPTGLYELAGRGSTFGFSYLVNVRSHDAPCPGAH